MLRNPCPWDDNISESGDERKRNSASVRSAPTRSSKQRVWICRPRIGLARTTLADDGTYVSVGYGRPYERGRDNIFGSRESGALVPYGERWRTGANEATEITVGPPPAFRTPC